MEKLVEILIGRLEDLRTCSDYGTCNHCQYTWCPMELLEADEVIKIVNQLAEEHKNGWISVSERLPEKNQRCIISYQGKMNTYSIDGAYVDIDTFDGERFRFFGIDKVIAWQPLPAPYEYEEVNK